MDLSQTVSASTTILYTEVLPNRWFIAHIHINFICNGRARPFFFWRSVEKIVKNISQHSTENVFTDDRSENYLFLSMNHVGEFDLGPNDLHHLQLDFDESSETVGRSRLKARLFQRSSLQTSPSQQSHSEDTFQSKHESKSAQSESLDWENDSEKYLKEKSLRLKVQKSSFDARDKILELTSKLRSAQGDAQMWKDAASFERDAKEQADMEKNIAVVAKLDIESKMKIAQCRLSELETENKILQTQISEIQRQIEERENKIETLSETCSNIRSHHASVASELQKKIIDLKTRDGQRISLENSLHLAQKSCKEMEERLRQTSERREELETLHDRNTMRIRSLESSVSTYAAKYAVTSTVMRCNPTDR